MEIAKTTIECICGFLLIVALYHVIRAAWEFCTLVKDDSAALDSSYTICYDDSTNKEETQ